MSVYLRDLPKVLNNRTLWTFVFLYSLRKRRIRRHLARMLVVGSAVMFAVDGPFEYCTFRIVNFGVDEEDWMRHIMPGISRLSVLIAVWALYRSGNKDWAFVAGLVVRFVPTANFYVCRSLFEAVNRFLRQYRRLSGTQAPFLPVEQATAARFEATDCPICFEPLEESVVYSISECSHCFHRECLERWCRQNAVCPICKGRVPVQKAIEDWTKEILDWTWVHWKYQHRYLFSLYWERPLLQINWHR